MTSSTSPSSSVRERLRAWRPLTARRVRALVLFALALSLSGCATFRSYNKELSQTTNLVAVGKVDDAIKQLNKDNKGKDKDLLYYLELGMLQRLVDRYPDSQKAWMSANETVQAWEHTAQTDPSKLLPGAASYIINDKLRPYEGHDYEKVMLLTYIALNYLALGEYDNARVAIKQTHELEAVIADLRSKELGKVEQDARQKGARTSFKELNGYPVQTIDNPAVNALKNSYQSALSHYLAGFVYEALDEPSLAAPGYRLANELQPNQPLLEEALSGLDQRVAAPDDGLTDVLFVIGSGTAPALESRQFALPIPVNRTLILVPVSFPVMKPTSTPYLPGQLRLGDGQPLTVAPITSIDLMARRALKDDMPGIMLRGFIRSATKAATQYALQHQSQNQNSMGLAIAALAVAIGGAVTESADERTWRTLPSEIGIARARISSGVHTISLQTPEGGRSVQLNLSGRYAVVGLRLLRGQLFVMPVEAPSGGGGRQPGNAGTPPGPSTGRGPGTLEQEPLTLESSK
jgi:hypothetical protein